MTWLDALLIVLATYRAARMVAIEDGPGDVFSRLRGRLDPDQQTWIGRGLNCLYCVSFWAAPVVLGLYVLAPAVVWWLAASAAAALVWRWEQKR